MGEMKNVLFVCTGNTCRSPLAEGLFKKHTAERSDFTVSSAGLATFEGSSISFESEDILREVQAPLDQHRSQRVTQKLLDSATHVIAMTHTHLMTLEARFPNHTDKFYLLGEFIQTTAETSPPDVPDPIGMPRAAYQEVAAMIERAIPVIIRYIDESQPQQ